MYYTDTFLVVDSHLRYRLFTPYRGNFDKVALKVFGILTCHFLHFFKLN